MKTFLSFMASLFGCNSNNLVKSPEEIKAKMQISYEEMIKAQDENQSAEASRLFGFIQGLMWTLNEKELNK